MRYLQAQPGAVDNDLSAQAGSAEVAKPYRSPRSLSAPNSQPTEEFIAIEEEVHERLASPAAPAYSAEAGPSATDPSALPWAKSSTRVRSPLLRLHNGA